VGGLVLKWIKSTVPCFKKNGFKIKSSSLNLVVWDCSHYTFLAQLESMDLVRYTHE
jgi:hypothetical protein